MFNFTITSSPTGFVLVDKIVIDLGDKAINPISLDIAEDELPMHWSYDDCQYSIEHQDFVDCPVAPVEPNPISGAIGYWSPCMAKNCRIEFATCPTIIPSAVNIKAYLEDSAQIKVVIPEETKNGKGKPIVIETLSASAVGGWVNFTVDISSYHQYVSICKF